LHNAKADLGVTMRTTKAELPCFTVWKNTAALEDGYVIGLEPATNFPNFKAVERERGRVVGLLPKGRYECTLTVEILDDAASVGRAVSEIDRLQAGAKPIIHRAPQGDW
jgi:hypothetical protein